MMFSRATNLLVIFILLLVITSAVYIASGIIQFSRKVTDEPVGLDKLDSNENLSEQKNTSVAAPYSSTQIDRVSGELPSPSSHERFDVAGSVRDIFGNPLHLAIVQLSSIRANVQISAQSEVNGGFSFEQLQPANDYHLNVESLPRYVPFDAYNLTLTHRIDNWDFALEYVSKASLQGVIVDQLGNSVPALKLRAVNEEWHANAARISSDPSGHFSLLNFIPGRIILRSESPPYILIHGMALSPGEVYVSEFVVDIGSQQLLGMVTRDDGVPIPDVAIRMRFVHAHGDGHRSTTMRSTKSNTSGEFHFSGLGSGPRTLTFSSSGFRRYEADFDPSLNPGPYTVTLHRSETASSH